MNLSLKRIAFSWFGFWILIAGVTVFSLWRTKLRYGIDLVGGTYIKLQVQTEKAIETELQNRLQAIQTILNKESLSHTFSTDATSITITCSSLQDTQRAAELLKKSWSDMNMDVKETTIHLTFTKHALTLIQTDAVQRNIEVLRSRLDQLSVSEISISKHGEKDIVIELPDVKDPQQAKAMIGKAAVLEFKLVRSIGATPEDIQFEMGGELPSNLEILPGSEEKRKVYYLVSRYPELTGSGLIDAQATIDERGRHAVGFRLSPEAATTFYELTGRNINKPLAIILDGVVISAPTIQSQIKDSGSITGSRNTQEAKELALLLRSGAFVAPVTFEEERQIGPSLGAESIRQGITACLVGLALLFVFSIFYYSFSGFLAFLALVFNLVLVLFGMSQLHATLTLPGIAGLVLTLGMAIDASILIYERIKEELASGLAIRKSVQEGFSDAMVVILDANITTFIVGLVLYQFGTGPIQGFAVTMMLGIVATLLTGLFFLKSLFIFILDNFTIQKLRI